MHLVFERSRGQFRSNCNILALAWMPYYDENKFRLALFECHQRQLINLANNNARLAGAAPPDAEPAVAGGPLARMRRSQQQQLLQLGAANSQASAGFDQPNSQDRSQEVAEENQLLAASSQNCRPQPAASGGRFVNARISEMMLRYECLRRAAQRQAREAQAGRAGSEAKPTGLSMSMELADRYGLCQELGWLVLGNVGKVVGVSLTSTVAAPREPVPESNPTKDKSTVQRDSEDLIRFNDSSNEQSDGPNSMGAAGPECNRNPSSLQASERPDRRSARQNYNLRGHLDEVILVKWNELYQKLATVDSKGNVFIWYKLNGKFTVQTPFYNRSKCVADFKWSNDGKIALICYTDSFILVGSSSGQRHWHSMLNLDDYHITCASWSPNDDQLLLGVSNGNVVLIDLPNSELTELEINESHIRTMSWSTCELNFRHLDQVQVHTGHGSSRSEKRPCSDAWLEPGDFSNRPAKPAGNSSGLARNSMVVNHRRLSRDCSLFSRYRFCSQGPTQTQANAGAHSRDRSLGVGSPDPQAPNSGWNLRNDCGLDKNQRNILAIDFANNTIKLFSGGLDDPCPKTIQVNQESYIMSWSSDGSLLAVAGFSIHTTAPSPGCLRCRYQNAIKFYNANGQLVHEQALKCTRYPITAFTWAHQDTRIFVATGPRLHCAKVFLGIPPLSLLASSCLQRHTRLADKNDVIELVTMEGLVVEQDIKSWQSSNCTYNLNKFHQKHSIASRKSLKHSAFNEHCHLDFAGRGSNINNINLYRYRLPLKFQINIDQLFLNTIRQPFDERWQLKDVIWHVPKDDRRYYCTLICYSSDSEYSSGLIHRPYPEQQYRPNGGGQSSSYLNGNPNQLDSADQYKIFVLYVEFQGSLIPVLRARRVGFLKPEFVIFDPEEGQHGVHKHRKVSDISFKQHHKQQSNFATSADELLNKEANHLSLSPFQYHDGFLDNCSDLHQCIDDGLTSGAGSMPKQSLLSDAEHYYNFDTDQYSSPRRPQLVASCGNTGNVLDLESCSYQSRSETHERIKRVSQEPISMMASNPYLMYMLSLTSGNNQATPSKSSDRQHRVSRHRSRHNNTSYRSKLTENRELVRIRSNIWATKFKLINVNCKMFEAKSILARVAYKANILHLQPRQIYLSIKDMSNYCCFCSAHHHTESSNLTRQVQRASQVANIMDLYDHQLQHKQTEPQTVPSSQPAAGTSSNGLDNRKVLVNYGDTIRVSPRLEPQQRYVSASKSHRSSSSCDRESHSKRSTRQSAKAKGESFEEQLRKIQAHKRSTKGGRALAQSSDDQTTADSGLSDDILTLSLSQGDQVRVEMSSLGNRPVPAREVKQNPRCAAPKLDEFLASNTTLKSIQTITRMIEDMSSRATGQQTSTASDQDELPSPRKWTKVSEDCKSPSAKYVAPDTPVHRPRKVCLSSSRLVPCSGASGAANHKTQSACSSPMKERNYRTRSKETSQDRFRLAQELPEPPMEMPIGRRLSSSAKRFIDGSLRFIHADYSAGSEAEAEESEPLVSEKQSRRRRRAASGSPAGIQSQPTTPSKSSFSSFFDAHKARLDLSSSTSMRQQLLKRLLNNNKNPSTHYNERSPKRERRPAMDRYTSKSDLGASSEGLASGEESHDEDFSIDSDSSDSQISPSDGDGDCQREAPLLSRSVRELRSLPALPPNKIPESSRRNRARRKHRSRKTLCGNNRCCCGKEFRLNNRPPVWNEQSQVYQLDFGGRVTQESAKNLQIDFDNKLALQFGRIDRCTYTLDYKYPFNAVQAMAVALASLTQRLK